MALPQAWLFTLTAAIGGMVAGALLCVWLTSRAAKMRQYIPRRWPLNPRLLASTEERKVWHWLNETFADHHIMLKLPVTRFTLPRSKEQGQHWYKLLSGIYCTVTVCAPDGRVMGCVDVPGNNRISRSNRQLKQTLLSQCGIAYWVISSAHLPTAQEIRTEFLGETMAPPPDRHEDEDRMAATHQKLRASLSGQRKGRQSDWAPLKPMAKDSPDGDNGFSNFGSALHQENSFLVPLDSRKGTLR